MRAAFLVLVLLLVALFAFFAPRENTARAQEDAAAVLDRAEAADERMAFAEALALYEVGAALDPTSARAATAMARAANLRAHAEGGFAPLAMLEDVRRHPARADDPGAVAALVHAAGAFPPGLVRVEARVLAAAAYAHRLGRPLLAEPLLAEVIADPLADRVTVQKAARDLVELTIARGDLAAATRAASIDPALAAHVARLVRRSYLHDAAVASLLAVLALTGLAVARARPRARVRAALARGGSLIIAYCIYLAVAGALLAIGYEGGSATPFLDLGLVLVPLLLLARAWAAAGSATRRARIGRAALCAASALGAAFLVLEHVDASYLDGVGL